MSWRLTPEERRMIERTRRSGEQQTPPSEEGHGRLWRSVLTWTGGIVFFVLFGWLITYLGTRIR